MCNVYYFGYPSSSRPGTELTTNWFPGSAWEPNELQALPAEAPTEMRMQEAEPRRQRVPRHEPGNECFSGGDQREVLFIRTVKLRYTGKPVAHSPEHRERFLRLYFSLMRGICLLICFYATAIQAQESATVSSPQVQQQLQQQPVGKTSVKVEMREAEGFSTFAVVGLTKLDDLRALTEEQLKQMFAIRVQATDVGKSLPPLLGEYNVTDSQLQFISRFPLSTSVKYRVELAAKLTGGDTSELIFAPRGKPLLPAPVVKAIYPSSDKLPENLLKFYIHFSAPMSRGEAYKRIHLMHEGTEVPDPFLELGEELWDVEQTRFTLFIHPGRIKHGVKPREDSGLPMTDGKEYSLQIDQAWLGADRQPLAAKHVKKFRVVAADETQPNPVNWKIGTPKASTREPVTLTFNEPLDHAMLNRVLQVREPAGEFITGKVTISEHETVWSFEPAQPWKRSDYAIEVATNLEDLTGNSIARPFETTMQVEGEEGSGAALVAIEFTVE